MIREALADRIVHGTLRPGDPLDETSLAAEYGVSRTPIREVLRQLETNGLALSRPHRGAIVVSLTPRQLDETFVVMAELEALSARLCATAMAGEDLQALQSLHASGAGAALANDVAGYRLHNERFHAAIYAGSGNAFLEETALAVRRRLAPFRNLQFEAFQRPELSHREHERIVDAIVSGNGEAAASAMRAHILIVRQAVDAVDLAVQR
ncbi:FCD domain-containing protein [Jiella sp. 40Bstr34]|uniref:FCD domain-containing protein n=2 Tax=Jiella pacifica TaxID=2696469 RepID=A0A6N9T851_9HYPH|nr:FCD domain-containing protein [Jiella pacifica]